MRGLEEENLRRSELWMRHQKQPPTSKPEAAPPAASCRRSSCVTRRDECFSHHDLNLHLVFLPHASFLSSDISSTAWPCLYSRKSRPRSESLPFRCPTAVKACPSLRVGQDHIDRKCSRWYPTVCTLSVKDLVRTRQGTSGHRTLRQLYCSPRKMDPTMARKQYRGAQGPCCRGVVRIQRQYGQLSTQYVSPYPHGIGRR